MQCWVERTVRISSGILRRAALVIAIAVGTNLTPGPASAGFLDFLFGGNNGRSAPQANAFADPFGFNPAPAPAPAPVSRADAGRYTGYCVRSCDGRYFPVQARGSATPAQMCQSFCPATPTQVYFGSNIDGAISASGERYADSDNAFAYRKALKADCTCNGRDPTGLAPVDLSLDATLRPGDVIATSNGLVAYSGVRVGNSQTAEFTPVANYPGLTADVRAKLGEMKVTPVSADLTENTATPLPDLPRTMTTPANAAPKTSSPKAKRADLD
jgi:uncharacterized protein DUF2865